MQLRQRRHYVWGSCGNGAKVIPLSFVRWCVCGNITICQLGGRNQVRADKLKLFFYSLEKQFFNIIYRFLRFILFTSLRMSLISCRHMVEFAEVFFVNTCVAFRCF